MIKKYLFLYLFFIKQLFCLEHFFISQNQNYKFNLSFLDDIKLKYKKFENNLFFDRNFIVDIKKVKDFCKSLPEHSEFKVLTKDNQEIDVSFFNRNSDKLIFIGPGFSNQKENLIPFAPSSSSKTLTLPLSCKLRRANKRILSIYNRITRNKSESYHRK